METILLNPWFRHAMVLLHICASLFWMGWIVFIFLMLVPVIRRSVPDVLSQIMPVLQQRVRKAVFWMIIVIFLTGIYNMYYLGLFDARQLFYTGRGHRFLTKTTAAFLLFGIYFLAPYVTDGPGAGNSHPDDSCCAHEEGQKGDLTGVVLHVAAFLCGMTAAYLGLSL